MKSIPRSIRLDFAHATSTVLYVMAGIMAARLAEAGFTANTDALEHPQGFLHAISPTGTEDRASDSKAGTAWAILSQGLGIKKYPTCYCTHRAIDCMLDLVKKFGCLVVGAAALLVACMARSATESTPPSP